MASRPSVDLRVEFVPLPPEMIPAWWWAMETLLEMLKETYAAENGRAAVDAKTEVASDDLI
jgi:hypothetical protein